MLMNSGRTIRIGYWAVGLAVAISLLIGGIQMSSAQELWNGEPGVLHTSPAPRGSMVALEDGSVILFRGSEAMVSQDGGRTWEEGFTLKGPEGENVGFSWVIGLGPGRLAGFGSRRGLAYSNIEGGAQLQSFMRISEDGGRTWSASRDIVIPEEKYRVKWLNRTPIHLSSGRLLLPMCHQFGKMPDYDFANRPFLAQNLYGGLGYFSDDEGLTWDRSADDVIVHMADFGMADAFGIIVEPAVVELKDGRAMMVGRTRLGQLFQSLSADGGFTWSIPQPMQLASSYAPAEIKRIPTTGDLLICWNQLSREEVINGLGRHRLSVAISTDEGETWGNFNNLYSLDDCNYIRPETPQPTIPGPQWIEHGRGEVNWEFDASIGKVGTRGDVGSENVYVLPEDFPNERYYRQPASIRTCYPIICVTGENVLVSYEMGYPIPMTTALDVIPIHWLYEPIVPEGPYAKLVVDGTPIVGADISIEDGTAFGWADVLGKALGILEPMAKRTRVPVRIFLQNHGVIIGEDGWKPNEGPKGTIYAQHTEQS